MVISKIQVSNPGPSWPSCLNVAFNAGLTLYQTIPYFNDPEKEDF